MTTRPILSLLIGISASFATAASAQESSSWKLAANGQAEAIIVTEAKSSRPIQIAADDLQKFIRQISGAHLPQANLAQLDEQSKKTVIFIGPAPQQWDVPTPTKRDALVIQTMQWKGRPLIYLGGNGDLGAMYATYRFCELLGVRFFHPGQYFVPQNQTLEISNHNIIESPAFKYRGLQQHTLHPIPFTTIFMDKPTPENLQRSKEYVDWLAHNRQNYLYWWWLERTDPVKLRDYVNKIVTYAHDRGVKVGIVVGMPFVCPQGSYNILQCDVCHEDVETWTKGLHKGTDEMAAMGLDSLCVFFGYGEGHAFHQPEGCPPVEDPVQPVLERIEVLREYINQQYPDLKLMLWIHPFMGAKGNEQCPHFFLLPKLCKPDVGAAVHTVMFYNLFDPAPTVYAPNFSLLREFTLDQKDKRPVWFWPETSYACGFDSGVPQWWPAYLTGRWADASFLADQVEGHITFTTGNEWLYWFNDYAVAKFGWNPKIYDVETVIDEYASIYENEEADTVRRVLLDLTLANDHYLVRICNQKNVNLMDMLSVGPMLRHISHMNQKSIAELRHYRELMLPNLQAFTDQYKQSYQRLNKLDDKIKSSVRPWYNELLDTIEITWVRCEHQLQAFDMATSLRLADQQDTPLPNPDLEQLYQLQKRARQIIARREKQYRYPNGRYRGPYVGYMRPFAEWEHVAKLVEHDASMLAFYANIEQFVKGQPSDFAVRKPVGSQKEVVFDVPKDFPIDQTLYLLIKMRDIDSPQEGSVTFAGQEYPLKIGGNSLSVTQQIELPPETVQPGKQKAVFTFKDDVNGTTTAYDVSQVHLALLKK